MNPSVTYSGEEVALLAGALASALPHLDESDFDVVDLLLDRALAALPRPLFPELEERLRQLRVSPTERFWNNLVAAIPPGQQFDVIAASVFGQVSPSRALELLRSLTCRRPRLRNADPDPTRPLTDLWVIEPEPGA